jgi:hypothetical protein
MLGDKLRPAVTRCDIATAQCILYQPDRRFWIVNFYDQFVAPLVMQINDDGLLRVMHVPEDSPAVLIEGSRRDDSGHAGFFPKPQEVLPCCRTALAEHDYRCRPFDDTHTHVG